MSILKLTMTDVAFETCFKTKKRCPFFLKSCKPSRKWNYLRTHRPRKRTELTNFLWNRHGSHKSIQQTKLVDRQMLSGDFPSVSRSRTRSILFWKWFFYCSTKNKTIILGPTISLVWYISEHIFTSFSEKSGGYPALYINLHFGEQL